MKSRRAITRLRYQSSMTHGAVLENYVGLRYLLPTVCPRRIQRDAVRAEKEERETPNSTKIFARLCPGSSSPRLFPSSHRISLRTATTTNQSQRWGRPLNFQIILNSLAYNRASSKPQQSSKERSKPCKKTLKTIPIIQNSSPLFPYVYSLPTLGTPIP